MARVTVTRPRSRTSRSFPTSKVAVQEERLRLSIPQQHADNNNNNIYHHHHPHHQQRHLLQQQQRYPKRYYQQQLELVLLLLLVPTLLLQTSLAVTVTAVVPTTYPKNHQHHLQQHHLQQQFHPSEQTQRQTTERIHYCVDLRGGAGTESSKDFNIDANADADADADADDGVDLQEKEEEEEDIIVESLIERLPRGGGGGGGSGRPSTKTTSATTTAIVPTNNNSMKTTTTPNKKAKKNKKKNAAVIIGMKNFIASGCAAGCSKLILAPFDTIKTLQQHQRSTITMNALSFQEAIQVIMKRPRGIWELYSGVGVAVVGSMPSVGLYFGVYSFCKKSLSEWGPPSTTTSQTTTTTTQQPYLPRVVVIALSAAIGNTVASASRVPYEVIKQKLQTNVYSSLGEAIQDMTWKNIFPTGGIASQMLRDIPYAVVTLLTYEYLQSTYKTSQRRKQQQQQAGPTTTTLSSSSPPPPTNRAWDMVLGGISGGLGSYVTNPLDVIKTRLQTSSDLYNGSIRTCIIQTYNEGGCTAFLRGSIPRLMHKVPANGFFFLFYEMFRSLLHVEDNDNDTDTE